MTGIGARPTSTERRLNDRYVNSYRTSAWRQLNVENVPEVNLKHAVSGLGGNGPERGVLTP